MVKVRKKKIAEFDRDKMIEIMNLTTDQHNGLYELNKWYKEDENIICLSGSAGTGKSTLVKEFIKANQLYYDSCCVAAPTHQAKEVISEITGIKTAKSVQELLGLKPDIELANFSPNNPIFKAINRAKMLDYDMVIIDEASMVNKELHKQISTLSKDYNIKVLYVGDPYQLNPINERLSTVFTNIRNIELNEIVRQKGTNPINELISLARADVINNTETFINFIRNHTDVRGNEEGYNIFRVNKDFFNELCLLNRTDDLTKCLSYTNDVTDVWNTECRKVLLNSPKDIITDRDNLIATNNIGDGKGEFIIQNSSQYEVVGSLPYTNTRYGLAIKTYDTHLKKHNKTDSYVHIVHPDSYQDFIKIDDKQRYKALTYGWKAYYQFRNSFCLMETLNYTSEYITELSDRNMEVYAKQIIKRDLAYNFCLTVHKSQGSTYNNIFLNLVNIMRNRNKEERNRLIYVGLSRARKSISILTN